MERRRQGEGRDWVRGGSRKRGRGRKLGEEEREGERVTGRWGRGEKGGEGK